MSINKAKARRGRRARERERTISAELTHEHRVYLRLTEILDARKSYYYEEHVALNAAVESCASLYNITIDEAWRIWCKYEKPSDIPL